MTCYYPFLSLLCICFLFSSCRDFLVANLFLVCFVVHIISCEDDIKAMYVHFSNNDAPLPCLALPLPYPLIPAIIALQLSPHNFALFLCFIPPSNFIITAEKIKRKKLFSVNVIPPLPKF
ncbi:hypothetical protein HDV63DRAFT_294118 [Trichoderma sp. SZMC 28014]